MMPMIILTIIITTMLLARRRRMVRAWGRSKGSELRMRIDGVSVDGWEGAQMTVLTISLLSVVPARGWNKWVEEVVVQCSIGQENGRQRGCGRKDMHARQRS
jgi:hypothetical protein